MEQRIVEILNNYFMSQEAKAKRIKETKKQIQKAILRAFG